MADDYRDINRANWDERAPAHAASADYAVERFLSDPQFLSQVVRFDLPRMGEITDVRAVHLQCHIGTDTLSLRAMSVAASAVVMCRISRTPPPGTRWRSCVTGWERLDPVADAPLWSTTDAEVTELVRAVATQIRHLRAWRMMAVAEASHRDLAKSVAATSTSAWLAGLFTVRLCRRPCAVRSRRLGQCPRCDVGGSRGWRRG